MRRLLYILIICMFSLSVAAQTMWTDSVKIYFRQSRINYVPTLHGNQLALDKIADSLAIVGGDTSLYRLRRIHVVGAASPEGSIRFNKWLSENRAATLFKYLTSNGTFLTSVADSVKTHEFLGRDWRGLLRMVQNDYNTPSRDEVIALLNDIISTDGAVIDGVDPLIRLKRLAGGKPYLYMYRKMFPELRASKVVLWFDRVPNPFNAPSIAPRLAPLSLSYAHVPEISVNAVPQPRKAPSPFYMSLRTNMLYDLGSVPNIGADFYLGKNFSLSAFWTYAWWKTDRKHWYWRTYGGDVALRYWFGKAAAAKPLTGHHIGIYAQALTYDFEFGNKGYMAGQPGGNIFDQANLGAGIEYGYSLPIAPRLNLDFTASVGYMGGKCWEYVAEDDCYVWQRTKKTRWFGPTKLEVSLVWLIGKANINLGKGGKR